MSRPKTAVPSPRVGLFTLLLLGGLVPVAPAVAADWPQFRGIGGQGVAEGDKYPVRWTPDRGIAWKTALPGPGASSPVVFGDRIYLTCYSGYGSGGGSLEAMERHLLCLSRTDGVVRWSKLIPVKQLEQDRIREGHGYATNTPAVDADRVYVFAGKSGMFAFDHDGKQLWQANCGERLNNWGSAASPVLHKNLVIVNASVESDSLFALEKATGKTVWRVQGIKDSWNTPVLAANPAGKTELVLAIMQKVLGFDPDTGKELWSCKTDINWYMAPSLVVDKGVAYCVGGRTGGGLAVKLGGSGDVTATHRLWTINKGSNVTSPVFHDGHLYWMHENEGIAYCAEAATGRIVYEEKIGGRVGQVYASPVLAGGNLYYTTRNGRTTVVPAKPQFAVLETNELEQRGIFNASPAAANGRLYIRSDKFLYCTAE